MIRLAEKARLTCDETNCKDATQVSLVLLTNGTFGVDATRLGDWQVLFDRDGVGPYRGRCPAHRGARPGLIVQ